jgi:hypothetical protein
MSAEKSMKGTVLGPRQRVARVALIVLASLTLSLQPLRALCEIGRTNAAQTTSGHQTTHDGTSDLCCTSIDDSALVRSVAPDLSGGPSVAPLVVLLVPGLILSVFAEQPLQLASAPPPSRSYYARSSRILR